MSKPADEALKIRDKVISDREAFVNSLDANECACKFMEQLKSNNLEKEMMRAAAQGMCSTVVYPDDKSTDATQECLNKMHEPIFKRSTMIKLRQKLDAEYGIRDLHTVSDVFTGEIQFNLSWCDVPQSNPFWRNFK